MKTARISILIVVLALISMPAFAQRRMQGLPPDDLQREEGEFAPNQGPGGPHSEDRREEVRKKIEAIRIWRMTEDLRVDANTSAKLSALLSSVDQKRREIRREQMETMKTLRQTLRSQKPDESRLKQLLDKLESNHRALQELRNEERKGLKDILTIEQQARFLLFQQEFQREMRKMISGARGRGGVGGPGNSRMREGPGRPPETR